ncbi:MAG: pseudouridine synthase [Desulfocapsaceae bacterium]|jgi:pseudouridine synthase|nr:pseudouridine synthase [Desulfocapsaceae bacterium]
MALKEGIRLQKYLASSGIASRRKAEEIIKSGRVRVDGTVITEMGVRVNPDLQVILCDGRRIRPRAKEEAVYILLNKPRGYVTTVSDPQGRPVVTSLLKDIPARVYPVGRLDLDTEGALLMTNDGGLAHKILHPRFETNKTYEALVEGIPSPREIKRLRQGIIIDGKKTWPAVITLVKQKERTALYRVTIHEGRKRQIRKMFGAIAHPVRHLKRTAYGRLTLGSLKSGSYRFLSAEELKKIFL